MENRGADVTVPALPPVWLSHTSLRWVIPTGKRGAAPGGLAGQEATFPWLLVSLHGVPTSPGAGGTPGLCPSPLSEWKSLGFPRSRLEFHRDFSSTKPGMVLLLIPQPAPVSAQPWDVPGRAGAGNSGMQREWEEAVPTPGFRSRTSLLCPRSCSSWDNPTFGSFPVRMELVKKREKLFLLGCFPSWRVQNPAQAQPG